MTVEERRRRRFSESFRKEQVSLIESGELTTKQVSRLYEVKEDNVRRWLVKFGKKALPEGIVIGHAKDFDRLQILEKEIKSLKELVADQQVALVYKEGCNYSGCYLEKILFEVERKGSPQFSCCQ